MIEKWIKQTHSVTCLTKINFFHELISEIIIQYLFGKLICWFVVPLVIEKWLKQTHFVIYFTKTNFSGFIIWTVQIDDDLGYIS